MPAQRLIQASRHLAVFARVGLLCVALLSLGCAVDGGRAGLPNACLLDALRARHELASAGIRAQLITSQRPGSGRGHVFAVWSLSGTAWAYDASQGARCISADLATLRDPLRCARLFLGSGVQWAVFYPPAK